MNTHFLNSYQRILHQKGKSIDSRLLDFQSHKQRPFDTNLNSQQYKFQCEMQLKALIHQWLNYEYKLNRQQPSLSISKVFLSQASNQFKQLREIQQQNHYQQQKNISLENNPLSVQLVLKLSKNHAIFKKVNFNLAETLINIGVFSLYKKNEMIPYVFYSQKQKNKCNQKKQIGFIIYGKLQLFDKLNKYQKIIDQNETIGQQGIQSLNINFSDYRDVKVKSFADQTAILWITKNHYEILFKQCMKCGLKEQLRKLQSHLKMSWIKKAVKKF